VIRAYASEPFPITVTLDDIASGKIVFYDVRHQVGDLPLSPTLSGILPESDDVPGVYTTMVEIFEVGSYFVYTACSGYLSEAEEIIIEQYIASLLGCYVPEATSESFGSVSVVVNKSDIKFSTEQFIPSIKVSVEN
jgi:hypothetical protein